MCIVTELYTSLPQMESIVVFRVDGTPKTGTGHVMRCFAIAHHLFKRYEIKSIFIGNINGVPWLISKLKNSSEFISVLDIDSFPSKNFGDYLIIDSYTLSSQDPIYNRKWKNILCIVDDSTPLVDANIYVHCGLRTNWREGKFLSNKEFYQGIEFVPLRDGFINQRQILRVSTDCPNVLITGGGTDSSGYINVVSDALARTNLTFKAFVLSNSDLNLDSRFIVQPLGDFLDFIIPEIDLVFTSSGTSSWEFILSGIPTGVLATVDNQVENYLNQISYGISYNIGTYDSSKGFRVNSDLVVEMVRNNSLRNAIKEKALYKFSGNGAERISNLLLQE